MQKTELMILRMSAVLLAFLLPLAQAAPRTDAGTGGSAVAKTTCYVDESSWGHQGWSIATFENTSGAACYGEPSVGPTACVELLSILQSAGLQISAVTGGPFAGTSGATEVTTYTLTGTAADGAAIMDALIAADECQPVSPPG